MKEISPGFQEKMAHLRSGIRGMYRVSENIDLVHSGNADRPISVRFVRSHGRRYHPMTRDEALSLAAALLELTERDLA
ncbi:hypothetical protein [uncultured Tateyamaria sp.]|nr:hypothetical protein [uncultured Tateyamaria sp.]